MTERDSPGLPREKANGVRRVHHHSEFPAARIAAERTQSISVVLPARNEEATIGRIVAALMELVGAGAIDQVLVADASLDRTAELARAAGADVVAQGSVLGEHGAVRGKGDAMWRGLAASRGELVCFLDADTIDFSPHFACGLLGPLVCGSASFVKGAYRRPFAAGGSVTATGGGRVTELCARPLLRRFFPEVAWLRQPLAGEVAASRALLERLPFTCGYGVDVGLLLDAARLLGPGAIAEADLDVRQNAHQPLEALGAMADEVLAAVSARLVQDGRLLDLDASVIRPPIASLSLGVA